MVVEIREFESAAEVEETLDNEISETKSTYWNQATWRS